VKNKFSLALMALIILALSLPAFVLAQQKRDQSNSSAGAGTTSKSGLPASAPIRRPRTHNPVNVVAVEQDFNEALSVIQAHYIEGNKLDLNNVYKSSIIGALRTLDPHSNYFDKEEFDELKTDQRSEYFGIGASIQNYAIGDAVETYVAATFENAPASRAGLRFGDRIDEVDGVSMHGKSSAEVRDKIRGPRGSHVKLTITHASTGKTDQVEIVRDAVPQPSVPDAYMVRPGVGYIDMTRGFNYDTIDGLQTALDFLHKRNMTSLVLDLRNNPGGFLEQAIRVADTFLPAGQVILTQKGRNGLNDREYKSRNTQPDRTPLVILVNDYTASASEIVAGAMQDHDRALIVGQTSFGKGLVQSIIPLEGGAGLTLTSAKYYTPSGRLIQRDYSDGGFYNYIYRGGTLRDNQDNKPAGPAKFTDTGRPVYGGGGITPDAIVQDDTLLTAEQQLVKALAPKSQEYRTALLDYALELSHQVNASFQVAPTWSEELRRRVEARGIKLEPQQWNGGKRWIDQQLDFWVARFTSGDSAAKRRQLPVDAPLRRAIDMMNRGQTQKDLFTLALAPTKALNDAKAPANAAASARPEARPERRPQ
jgi:carboxyl-terminal processing protease